MNCCVNCFADQGLRSRIEAESKGRGSCDFCSSKDVPILVCEGLSDMFEQIFVLYTNHATAILSLKKDISVALHEHIDHYWPSLFNQDLLKTKDIKHLVNQIGRGWGGYEDILFEQPVELQIYLNGNVEDEVYDLQYDTFAKEIKDQNRFFISQTLDLDLLESVFSRFAKTYPKETLFYRARISEDELPLDKLGKPPKEITTPGRANPIGIPYLYISDQEKTTLYETRVSLHESITVGTFVLHTPISVISLKDIALYGPFEIQDRGFEIEEFIKIRSYLLKLEEELSKPVRKQDVNLDYLPTQYLCEFIKSLGFDGVEYRSAMAEGGYNLAVFNDKNLECVTAKHYQVKVLKYDWK